MKKQTLFFSLQIFLFCLLSISVFSQTDSNQADSKQSDKEETLKYEAQFQFTNENLTRNLGNWRTASFYFQRTSDSKQIVWANYRHSNRNNNRDEEVVVGMYQPLKNKWAFTAEGMYSPTHKYVGKYSVMGEVEKVLKKGVVLHLGGRFTKYDAIKANTGYGIVEKYWGNNRGAYTLYVTKLSNAGTAPTHRFQYNRYYGERVNSFGAAFSFGREHENLGPGIGILRSNTWSIGVSARHWLTKNIGVTADGTFHRQGDIYYRRGLTFGLRYRF